MSAKAWHIGVGQERQLCEACQEINTIMVQLTVNRAV